MSNPLLLYQLSIGHYASRALFLAAKLGLAELLASGPRPYSALAAETSTHGPSLRRVMRFLATLGVFEERDDDTVALAEAAVALRGDVPGSMRAMVLLFAGGTQDAWADLEYCVRTGKPAFTQRYPEGDAFTALANDPVAAAVFDQAMAAFAPMTAAAVAASYEFSRFGTVADVGGGNGALLVGILQANPGVRGLVFDRPDVAERARAHVAQAGLADRCAVAGGSFFDAVPPGADAYLLKHVIHDWDDAKAVAILHNVRAAMPPHGTLLLVEGVYPARVDTSLPSRGAAANDCNMLVATGGRQRSEAEFRELYSASGFRLTRVVPTPANVCVIEGAPA